MIENIKEYIYSAMRNLLNDGSELAETMNQYIENIRTIFKINVVFIIIAIILFVAIIGIFSEIKQKDIETEEMLNYYEELQIEKLIKNQKIK